MDRLPDEPDEAEAYRRHTAVTDPGPHAAMVRRLPSDVSELVPLLGNVLVHHSRVEGFVAGTGRPDDGTELRPLRRVLDAVAALDDRPWTRPRAEGRRLVVDCRTVAVLLTAVLREHGLAARARFGFAGYLEPSHWQSHVVCEHVPGDGAEAGWTRTDPDLGRHGLGEDAFLDAGQAWRLPEQEQDRFGYGPQPALRGRWTVRWELVRDLAALTGFEPLTSDGWGILERPEQHPDAGEPPVFGRVAAARTRAERLTVARDPDVAVPRVIRTHPYLTGQTYEVDLVADGSLPVPAP